MKDHTPIFVCGAKVGWVKQLANKAWFATSYKTANTMGPFGNATEAELWVLGDFVMGLPLDTGVDNVT